jgi:hypothetical protein
MVGLVSAQYIGLEKKTRVGMGFAQLRYGTLVGSSDEIHGLYGSCSRVRSDSVSGTKISILPGVDGAEGKVVGSRINICTRVYLYDNIDGIP